MAAAMVAGVTDRWDGLLLGPTLATLATDSGYGLVDDGALGWKDGVLAFVGPRSGLPGDPASLADEVIEAKGMVTPGLVDCHTHLVFAGDRAAEFELRLQGASYEEIARSGGGILSSVRAVREADEDALLAQSLPRARALVADGATTRTESVYLTTERRLADATLAATAARSDTYDRLFAGQPPLPGV